MQCLTVAHVVDISVSSSRNPDLDSRGPDPRNAALMIGFASVGVTTPEAYSDDEIAYGAKRSNRGIRMQNVDTRDRIDRLDVDQSPAPG